VRHAGHRVAVTKAQVLLPAKRRCSSGHRCCVGRRSTRTNRGAILGLVRAHDGGTHLGFRSNAPPFAGRCGTRRPERWRAPLHAERIIGCGRRAREGPPLEAALARREGCAVLGTRRGFARPNDGANLHLAGVRSTREICLFGGSSLAQARQPEPPSQEDGKGRRREEVRHLSTQNESQRRSW